MAVVVAVSGVVDGVVTGAHHWPDSAVNTVMNIGRPDRFAEEENEVGHEVHRNQEEGYDVRDGLQDSV